MVSRCNGLPAGLAFVLVDARGGVCSDALAASLRLLKMFWRCWVTLLPFVVDCVIATRGKFDDEASDGLRWGVKGMAGASAISLWPI